MALGMRNHVKTNDNVHHNFQRKIRIDWKWGRRLRRNKKIEKNPIVCNLFKKTEKKDSILILSSKQCREMVTEMVL